ncbi:uncharacterized protein BO97DRAFT_5668 [Aspergillus homomorphus CBS 101889]|uniref:Uncharacterized protein n=1 Tax=Aspergillus homomorphus (strain CBS 101889) TaxID=1450537 RepID=A0A395IB13_ASPHC|nr:hypothetical protein BO97DRAFT_5668 [Aspergillus homomorphus CBS 101889]RAL17377.1 hypothetical protein BO97DRAFT_5668 [Aspergillus homomorphus CBS 101889]
MPNKISDVKSMSILNLAREAKFICDSDWHVRVARALRESNHLEEAEDEYNQAEENDANSWIIKTELALTLAARGNLREAVEKAKEALTRDPPPDTLSQSKIYLDLSVWQLARGRKSEAIEAAKNAYTREPGSLLKTAHYFQTLGRAGKYRLLIELCQELNRSDSTPTPLVQLLLGWEEGHDLFGEAAWNMNEMPFARKILEETVEAAEREGDFEGAAFEEDQRALYYLRHEQADRRPRLIWEKLHSRIPDIQTREYIEQLQCRSLCNDYYRKAVEAKSSKDQAAWVDKLEDLAKVSWRANTAAATPEHRGDAALMLSRWRRLYGNEKQTDKEKSLKELCRSKVCQGVRILEDDDPLNDADGYVILARALLSAGEEEEASQVFAAAMLPLLRRSQSLGKGDTRSSNALEAMQRAPLSPFPCHGKYGCKEDDWLALYVCRVCLDASFCISCLVKQANSRVCDKSHDMIQVYLKGRDLNSMQKPMAAFKEGQLEPDKEWLKELKQRWQITDDTIAATSLPTPEIVRKSQIKLKLFY